MPCDRNSTLSSCLLGSASVLRVSRGTRFEWPSHQGYSNSGNLTPLNRLVIHISKIVICLRETSFEFHSCASQHLNMSRGRMIQKTPMRGMPSVMPNRSSALTRAYLGQWRMNAFQLHDTCMRPNKLSRPSLRRRISSRLQKVLTTWMYHWFWRQCWPPRAKPAVKAQYATPRVLSALARRFTSKSNSRELGSCTFYGRVS